MVESFLSRTNYIIFEQFFGVALGLPTTDLSKFSDLPEGNTDIWSVGFSLAGSLVYIPVENHNINVEFRFLANVVAKVLLAKQGLMARLPRRSSNT